MPIDISGIVKKKADSPNKPLLNSMFFGTSTNRGVRTFYQGFNYKKFWNWFKTRPELYSVINIPITDTVGGKVEFMDLNGKKLGRNKMLKAERFWKQNLIKEVFKAIEFDRYVTGDGYGWKGRFGRKEIKRVMLNMRKEANMIASNNYQKLGFKESSPLSNYLWSKAVIDEDITGVKSFDYVASSTMQIIHDRKKVTGYLQRAGGQEQHFDIEEIIHLVLNRLDGKVEGWSPVQAMTAEFFLIMMIKHNMISFFENGGHPSKIYSLPDVRSVDDPNYRRLIDLLRESKSVINSNGSLVYVGKLQVDDLGSAPKDMEYKDLAMWLVSLIAFAFQIPSTRIPFLLSGSGGAVNKGDSGGVSDAGYWRMIETQQDYLEDVYNEQLFKSLGWQINFVRGNKQDRIRDTQAMVQMYDGVAKVQEILKRQKKKLSEEKLLKMLDFTGEDVEEISDEEMDLFDSSPMDRQNQMNQMQTMRNEATVDRSNNKRESSNNKGISN